MLMLAWPPHVRWKAFPGKEMSRDVIWRFERRCLLARGCCGVRLWLAILSERLEMMRGETSNFVLPHPLSGGAGMENEPNGRKTRQMLILQYGRALASTHLGEARRSAHKLGG
jgi:hypothetical protein